MFERVIFVTDRKISALPFLRQIEKVCRLKPQAVILREKDLPEADYAALAAEVQDVCRNYGVKFIIHTFWRTALTSGADAVQLPLPVLRGLKSFAWPVSIPIGVSVHSEEEAREAIRLGAAYLIAGHIYESSCKPGAAPRGTEFLRKICAHSPAPVYAIGGIGLGSAQFDEVMACGAAGVCVRSALMRL